MPSTETFRSAWLPLLASVEPEIAQDPAALGRAIRRWASLAAATHRAQAIDAHQAPALAASTPVEAKR